MSLRISDILLVGALGLAACAPEAGPPPGSQVECALGDNARWSAACNLEREAVAGRFILHHPDGGFRRLRLDPETLRLLAADGAERVRGQSIEGEALVFALGDNRYRVPLRLLAGEP